MLCLGLGQGIGKKVVLPVLGCLTLVRLLARAPCRSCFGGLFASDSRAASAYCLGLGFAFQGVSGGHLGLVSTRVCVGFLSGPADLGPGRGLDCVLFFLVCHTLVHSFAVLTVTRLETRPWIQRITAWETAIPLEAGQSCFCVWRQKRQTCARVAFVNVFIWFCRLQEEDAAGRWGRFYSVMGKRKTKSDLFRKNAIACEKTILGKLPVATELWRDSRHGPHMSPRPLFHALHWHGCGARGVF